MNVTIIAKCERCQEQFVFQCGSGQNPISSSNKDQVEFINGKKLIRKRYVTSMEVQQSYGQIQTINGEMITFCAECDRQYWENFNSAVQQLESFWKEDPVKSE